MTSLKYFFVGIFLFFFLFQQYTYAQSYSVKKAEKFSKQYAISELEEFLEFLNNTTEANDVKQVVGFLESYENYLAENRVISYRLPIGEPPYLLSERNWISEEHTILFYFPIPTTSSKATLQDLQGNAIDPSVLDMNSNIYPSFTIRGEALSLNRATLGMFFIALKAITNRYNRPRFNIRILIDAQPKKDNEEIKELAQEYGDDLYADLIFVFSGDRGNEEKPILEIPTAINSSDRIVIIKEQMNDLYGSPIQVIAPQTNQTEAVNHLSESLAIPIVSFSLFGKNTKPKNELTFLQLTEGIKAFIGILQMRF